jgi:hypothetical protein
VVGPLICRSWQAGRHTISDCIAGRRSCSIRRKEDGAMSESVGGAETGGAQAADGGWGGADTGSFSDALGAATEGGWDGGAAQHGDAGSHISAEPGGWGGGWESAATPTPEAVEAAAPADIGGSSGGGGADLAFMASMGAAALSVPWWSGPSGQVDDQADWLIAPDGALLVPLRPETLPNEALLVPAGGPLTPVLIMGATLIYRVGGRLYRLVRPGLPRVLDPQVLQPLADPSQLQPLNPSAARRIMQFLENPPPGHVLHHIVPHGGPIDDGRDASVAQAVLSDPNINIGPHDLEVLMWVPEEYHRSMHDQAYYDRVNAALRGARTRSQALEILAELRQTIEREIAAWRQSRVVLPGSGQ